MADAARFLLAYQQRGNDGLLHTSPSNAHETQMDVTDPATDISAIRTLYPATVAAARELGRDGDLAMQLQSALASTPALPTKTGADGQSDTILAASADVDAPYRNSENIGLEAIWPYALIGIDSPLFSVARNTYRERPFKYVATWSLDPVQAARLGLGDEAAKAIFELVQRYQVYANGMSALLHDGPNEFYIEQAAITALALSSMLVTQDNDHVLRIGEAIPSGWTMHGAVSVEGGGVIEVSAAQGKLVTFSLNHAPNVPLQIATPWMERQVRVWKDDRRLGSVTARAGRFSITPEQGHTYRFAPTDQVGSLTFNAPAMAIPQVLGRASIGLGPPCCAPPDGYKPTSDR